jgi:hypothetical protein
LADSPTAVAGAQAPADGAVFFTSPDALTSHALADQPDSQAEQTNFESGGLVPNIYEYDAGQVHLISDGHDTSTVNTEPGSELIGWDATGDDVFFITSDPLIPEDEDTQQDLYDARVEGGVPTPVAPSACGSEACRGALTLAPQLALLGGTATQAAEAESPPATTPAGAPQVKAKAPKRKTKSRKRPKVHKPLRRATRRRTARQTSMTSRRARQGRR